MDEIFIQKMFFACGPFKPLGQLFSVFRIAHDAFALLSSPSFFSQVSAPLRLFASAADQANNDSANQRTPAAMRYKLYSRTAIVLCVSSSVFIDLAIRRLRIVCAKLDTDWSHLWRLPWRSPGVFRSQTGATLSIDLPVLGDQISV